MTRNARLHLEHLEDRTALNSPAAMVPPVDYGYAEAPPVQGMGPAAEVTSMWASPLFTPYGPSAVALTFTVTNLGNEMTAGSNVVIREQGMFDPFFGYYPGQELASVYVGSLAPGQSQTINVIVPMTSSLYWYGPSVLDFQTYSYYPPPPPPPNLPTNPNPNNVLPIIPFQTTGGDGASQPAAAVQGLAATLVGGAGPLADLINQLQLEEADVVAVTPEAAEEPLQGIEQVTLDEALDRLEQGSDGLSARIAQNEPDGGVSDDLDDELFRRPARRDKVPEWLKPLLKKQEQPGQQRDPQVDEDRIERLPEKPEDVAPRPARTEPATPPRSAEPTPQRDNEEEPAPAPPLVVAERAVRALTDQQSRMAYFVLLGTGLAALQHRLQPARAVQDRSDPRRKRLTRI